MLALAVAIHPPPIAPNPPTSIRMKSGLPVARAAYPALRKNLIDALENFISMASL